MKLTEIQQPHTTTRPGEYPAESLPEIAFLGRSNVGKSSLLNSLVKRKNLARTSKTPGRTRAIHWYRIGGDLGRCFFVDLPGYGFARVPRKVREGEWAKLIETYLYSKRNIVLAIQLLDIRRDGPTDLDLRMIEWLAANDQPTTFVLTKADKLSRSRRTLAQQQFASILETPADREPIPYSAITGEGRTELWSRIDTALRTS